MTEQCKGQRAEFEAESYVRGALPEAAAESFEEHFFSCELCFQYVEALQLAQKYLPGPAAAPQLVLPERMRPKWTILFGAAAAAIAITVVGIGMVGVMRARFQQQTARTSSPKVTVAQPQAGSVTPSDSMSSEKTAAEVQIAQLSEPVLPPYRAHTLRGEGQIDAKFEKGMKAYSAKDCNGAVQQLDQVTASSSEGKAARLYAGACHLRLNDLDTAQRDLQAIVEAGDSPQQETAMYLLAQVELAGGHSVKAKQLLERTVSLQGDYERKARAQLKQLAKIKIAER